MVAYLEEQRSRSAIWCQRLAVFLVPYFALVILLYRFEKIDTLQMFVLIAVGFMLAVISLVLALKAISELWNKGYRGGSQVVRGMVLTLLILLPFGYYTFLAIQHPLANDVSTNMFDPPQYINATQFREERQDEGMNPVQEYDEEYARKMIIAYPKLQSRRYPAGPERVLLAVRNIIEENEWLLTGSQGISEISSSSTEVGTTELADNAGEAAEEGAAVEENTQPPEDITIEAIESTLIFGYENDLVIRIVSEEQNTLVDVRSSSRWGKHDFGYNAKLIESFLTQLDTALLGIAGEG